MYVENQQEKVYCRIDPGESIIADISERTGWLWSESPVELTAVHLLYRFQTNPERLIRGIRQGISPISLPAYGRRKGDFGEKEK
jgi:hypothetical protein